jgi:hypothetical protein
MNQTKQLLMAVMAAVILMASTVLPVAAQNGGNPSGSGLSISPTLSEFTLKPGGAGDVVITLKNITVDDVVAKGQVNDFKSDNATGNPQIITDNTQQNPNSLRKFVSNLTDVPLAKGQQKTVKVRIQAPPDITPGAYYGIIRYRAVPSGLNAPGPGQVALTASVGTIVLVTVPGNIRTQVQAQGIHVYRGAHDGTLFFRPPTSIGVKIANFGNGFVAPIGAVEVHDTFNKLVTTYQLNNPKQPGNILPNSTRIFTHDISAIRHIGRYSIIASVSYGGAQGSQVLTLKKDIWYIPQWLGLVILIIIIGLAYFVYRAYHAYRREQHHSRRR